LTLGKKKVYVTDIQCHDVATRQPHAFILKTIKPNNAFQAHVLYVTYISTYILYCMLSL